MGRPRQHLTPDDQKKARARANKKYDNSLRWEISNDTPRCSMLMYYRRRRQRLDTIPQRAPRHKPEVEYVKLHFGSGIWGVQYGSKLRPPKLDQLEIQLPFKLSDCFPDKTLCLSDFFIANFVREKGWESRPGARWKEPQAYRFNDIDSILANASLRDVEDGISGHLVCEAVESFRSRSISLDLLRPETFTVTLKQAIQRANWVASELDAVSDWISSLKEPYDSFLTKRINLAVQVRLWRLWELCFLRAEIHERQQRSRRTFAKSVTDGTTCWAKNIRICCNSSALHTRITALLIGKLIDVESCEDFGTNICNGSCMLVKEHGSEDDDDSEDEEKSSDDTGED